jgi:integrase
VATAGRRATRSRGTVETLPSGSLRVKVYAGLDPVSGRRHFLTEVVPAGPQAQRLAERARTRLLAQVDERRNPRTSATVAQLIDRHLELLDVVPTTRSGYEGYVRLHIVPAIGAVKVGALDADVLDSFYAELRRCRDHCAGRPHVCHRESADHVCDEHEGAACVPPDSKCRSCRRRCQPHVCQPLSAATIRQIHFFLNSAYKRAVRWRWVAVNPVAQAEPPAATKPNPRPPTAEEAARIVTAAWEDPDWGTFVWLAITTGARRGELCAVRWSNVDLDRALLVIRQSVAKDGRGGWYLKDTKTHQQRRVALDSETVEILREQRSRYERRVASLRVDAEEDAFVFSLAADSSSYLVPESVTQRYGRLADRLKIATSLHALRHYSATELISAGVDIRTVAGRLGHSGGGVTTLRVYSAWRDEADQRAAATLSTWLPARPDVPVDAVERAKADPKSPYEVLAAKVRREILAGSIERGGQLPTVKQLAESNGVSVGTVHRAFSLLARWGLIEVSRGRRATVMTPAERLIKVNVGKG